MKVGFDMDRGMAEIHHSSEALKTMRAYKQNAKEVGSSNK